MSLHFVTEDATLAGVGDVVRLGGAEAHHAAAVRRVRAGEHVTLGDGRGAWLEGEVADVGGKNVGVRVLTRRDVPSPRVSLTLVQALAKGDRDELAIQAATELGIDRILPWQSERSVSRWDAQKAAKGRARWETIVREASKQAHRAWIPEVDEVAVGERVLDRLGDATVLVLEPTADVRMSEFASSDRDIVLVVGPEGGISPREQEAFVANGAALVRLGETVLRTSTAGPAAIAVLSAAIGRW